MKDLGTLVMVGGGIQQVNAVKIAQDAGYKILVTDRNENAPCSKVSDYFVAIDGRNVEDLAAYILIHKTEFNIKGIFTLTELVTTVAVVAEAAKLPSVHISSAITCQNKKLCKDVWIDNNISTPKGMSVSSHDEALNCFNILNKKVFIKPVVGFGGINSQKILSRQELKKVFSHSTKEMIIEEYIEGSMHDVNGLYDANGVFYPMGIVDRSFLDKFPVESRTSSPSLLDPEEQDELYKLLETSTRALGITWGPVKGDTVYSDKKFKMLEVAPRLHGPKSSLYVLPSSGVNCFELSLDVISGRNKLSSYTINQDKFSVCQAILPPIGSYFKSAMCNKNFSKTELLILKNNNYRIREYKNSADVPAYIMATSSSFQGCDSIIKRHVNIINENDIVPQQIKTTI
jgi:biotin carboxylase